jgi:hypothetical protein
MPEKSFTTEDARAIGEEIGIHWSNTPYDVEQFRMGMDVELEHGSHNPATNVTNDDPIATGKIARAPSQRIRGLLHATREDGSGRGEDIRLNSSSVSGSAG